MLLFRIIIYKFLNRLKIILFNKDIIGWIKNLNFEDVFVVGKVCKLVKCNSIQVIMCRVQLKILYFFYNDKFVLDNIYICLYSILNLFLIRFVIIKILYFFYYSI